MSGKKEILILFEGAQLAYSPTIAQLYSELEKDFKVTVFAQDPALFSRNYKLLYNMEIYRVPKKYSSYLYRIIFWFALLFSKEAKGVNDISKGNYQDYFFRFLKIKDFLKKKRFARIICVDLKNLFFVNTILQARSYFLSLELCSNEKLLPFIDTALIDCVIIQSPARYNYLFKDKQIRTFYIQNAPTYNGSLVKQNRQGLIYAGTAWDFFGFGYCLNYLKENPNETMTVLGAVKDDLISSSEAYNKLITNGNLVLNQAYLQDNDVVEFLSEFEIGFCFYNFDYEAINTFNYHSAPSGKVFKYLAAGVPVICNKIVGFDFVDEFECGIRIDKFDASTIHAAIQKIRSNYAHFVNGAVRAAEHFSFDKAVLPFIEYLKKDIN